MAEDDTDKILAKIDAAVGPPDDETADEHEQRRKMIQRDARAREIRRDAEDRP